MIGDDCSAPSFSALPTLGINNLDYVIKWEGHVCGWVGCEGSPGREENTPELVNVQSVALQPPSEPQVTPD